MRNLIIGSTVWVIRIGEVMFMTNQMFIHDATLYCILNALFDKPWQLSSSRIGGTLIKTEYNCILNQAMSAPRKLTVLRFH